jgi:hypothetical protein
VSPIAGSDCAVAAHPLLDLPSVAQHDDVGIWSTPSDRIHELGSTVSPPWKTLTFAGRVHPFVHRRAGGRSGVFAPPSGVLAAYRSEAVLASQCQRPNFEPARVVESADALPTRRSNWRRSSWLCSSRCASSSTRIRLLLYADRPNWRVLARSSSRDRAIPPDSAEPLSLVMSAILALLYSVSQRLRLRAMRSPAGRHSGITASTGLISMLE